MSPAEAGLKAAGFTVLATAARPLGGWLSDRVGGSTVLGWVFAGVPVGGLLLAWLATAPAEALAALLLLAVALGLGLGNGAVFKLVSLYFPKNTGLVTGVVGYVKGSFGNYVLGFVLLAIVAALCLLLLWRLRARTTAPTARTA
jgi:NNP family nitrate/nitrite transporter-like MFS transporter